MILSRDAGAKIKYSDGKRGRKKAICPLTPPYEKHPSRQFWSFAVRFAFPDIAQVLFLAFLPFVKDRYDEEEVLFPWRRVDVVEQSRLHKPCTGPKHTHGHTDTLPTLPPEVLDLHPSRPSPEEGKKQTGAPPSDRFFLNLACSRMSCPLAGFHIRMDRHDLKGERKPRQPEKRKPRIKRGCMMCCQEYMRVASSDIPIVELPADSFSV